ncbi:hypothetical protein [Leisingera sp. ANG-DT]|uniref:hypothetical protein n=1 Tax=Leisingera sp. ANG-DT TaxID=1577897 RepID=UPI00058293F5|nr:hypothetical protein [Leisingera sp. ANG-DT]KIC19564.1 hypothetical protein RA21_03435 [Leisingera sp. ANG-DT]
MKKIFAILGMGAISASIASFFLLTFFGGASAQESDPKFVNDLRLPTARFLLNSSQSLEPVYWDVPAKLQFAGDVNSYFSLYYTSKFVVFSEHARMAFSLSGDPENWLMPNGQIAPGVNYLVIFEDLETINAAANEPVYLSDVSVAFANDNSLTKQTLEDGVPQIEAGCYGKLTFNDVSKISSFVTIIDTSQPVLVQKDCMNYALPLSFGVYPVVTDFEFPDSGDYHSSRKFSSQSELVMVIRLSAYCRKTLGNFSLECPSNLLRYIYGAHEGVVQEFLSE